MKNDNKYPLAKPRDIYVQKLVCYSESFLDEVSPIIALIGVGENNNFGHPSGEVLNRLNELRCKSIQD